MRSRDPEIVNVRMELWDCLRKGIVSDADLPAEIMLWRTSWVSAGLVSSWGSSWEEIAPAMEDLAMQIGISSYGAMEAFQSLAAAIHADQNWQRLSDYLSELAKAMETAPDASYWKDIRQNMRKRSEDTFRDRRNAERSRGNQYRYRCDTRPVFHHPRKGSRS